MSRPPLFVRRRPQGAAWHYPAALAVVAGATLALGLTALWRLALSEPGAAGVTGAAGAALLLLSLIQSRIAWRVWQTRPADRADLYLSPRFWRWQIAGPFVAYLVALAIGPLPGIVFLFLALLSAWNTAAIAAHWLRRSSRETVAAWLRTRTAVRLGWLSLAGLALLVLAESSVRLGAWALGRRLPETYAARSLRLTPGHQVAGRPVNSLGYWDQPFEAAAPSGIVRVAAIGDGAMLAGTAETNPLEQVERRVPGLEVYNFALPHAGPRDYAAQLAADVLAYRPDLVLTFVAVGDDITREQPLPELFDWRSLGLYQLGAGSWQSDTSLAGGHTSYEDYLRNAGLRLDVCRTPIAPATEECWEAALGHLGEVLSACREADIDAALVVVPAEFQVSANVRDGARRNAGCAVEEIDVELPQRRLAAFASREQVPLLDLLPYLRAADSYPYERNSDRWNDCGNRVAAEALTGWLQHRGQTQVAVGP
jgi:hypothetical protein